VLGAHVCIDRAQLRGGLSDDRLPVADVHVAVENELNNRPGTFSTTRTQPLWNAGLGESLIEETDRSGACGVVVAGWPDRE
jgi:hypothetical protein